MDLVKSNAHIAINRSFGTAEFGKILEAAMEREGEFKTKESFAPSGLGYSGSCPRYWYYAFNGADFSYKNDGPSVANMDAGADAGKRLAKLLDKAGLLIDDEAEARYEDPPIFGYIDALINWKDEEVVVEIKTCKSSSWGWRAANNTVPGYQLIQLLIYMYVTNHEKGFFLTENKDTHEIFILPVKMNQQNKQLVEDVFDWMRTVHKNAVDGELPQRPFTKSSMQCKGCPVFEKCWEGKEGGPKTGIDPNPGTVFLPPLELPR